MIDKITQASLLYDFYGQLLTRRKQQVMELYHEENLSLSEIAEEFGISRSAVYESLKTAEKSLAEYEEKLGLVSRFLRSGEAFRKIDRMLDDLSVRYAGDEALTGSLSEIKAVISGLEED